MLAARGYQVRLAMPQAADAEPDGPQCCSRAWLAQDAAARAGGQARRLLAALLPQVRAGLLSPSKLPLGSRRRGVP